MAVALPGPLFQGDEARAPQITFVLSQEWCSENYVHGPEVLFNDTDRDGNREMVVLVKGDSLWNISIYQLPAFKLRWSADCQADWIEVGFADIGGSGTIQILIWTTWDGRLNLTVLDGATFKTLWTSPRFRNDFSTRAFDIRDFDADGIKELMFSTSIMDSQGMVSRLHFFSIADFQKEWEIQQIETRTEDIRVANLDEDPALELILPSELDNSTPSFVVYDGAFHEPQWSLPGGPACFSQYLNYIGDIDSDGHMELGLTRFFVNDTIGGSDAQFLVMAAGTGEPEWEISFPVVYSEGPNFQLADINNDSVQELLVRWQARLGDDLQSVNYTNSIIELRTHGTIWSSGDVHLNGWYSMDSIHAADVTGDSVPEIILGNLSAEGYNITVLDGRTFRSLWNTNLTFLMGELYLVADIDLDSRREIAFADIAWMNGTYCSTIYVYRADKFEELWSYADIPGYIQKIECRQAMGDARPELLLTVNFTYLYLFDTGAQGLLWTNPGGEIRSYESEDFTGDSRNELLVLSEKYSGESTCSTLSLYNGTALAPCWQSEPFQGTIRIVHAGNLDDDPRCELAIVYHRQAYRGYQLVVYETYVGYPPTPDLAVSDSDISISAEPLYDGMLVGLSARVSNPGNTDIRGGSVSFLMDGNWLGTSRIDIAKGASAAASMQWLAETGKHRLSIQADPANTIAEWDESNNNATLDFTVLPAPPSRAVIHSPSENGTFSEDDEILFNGSSGLPPEMADLTYQWRSNITGDLGCLPWFWAALPAGRHGITLNVTSHGIHSNATVNITVRPPGNYGLMARITSPTDGSRFLPGEPVFFDGTKSYPGERMFRLSYRWSSDLLGEFSREASFERSLPVGRHNITLEVDDGHEGRSSATVAIEVWDPAIVSARISSPSEGQSFDEDQTLLFDSAGSYVSPERPLNYTWRSNRSGLLGHSARFESRLVPGDHRISLELTDGLGHFARAAVNISVKPRLSHAPAVFIIYPAEGAIVNGTVAVSGRASDAVEVLAVDVRIDDGPWFAASGTDDWTFAWNTTRFANGPHRITARASDGARASLDFTVNVTVENPKKGAQPGPDGARPAGPAAAALAIAAVFAAAAGLLFRRSRRPRKGPPVRPAPTTSRP